MEADDPIRAAILAGKTLSSIWQAVQLGRIPGNGITRPGLSAARDEIMSELNASPDNVKALADGPLLNASDIVKYKAGPRKKGNPPVQLSILDIVDGHMGRAA